MSKAVTVYILITILLVLGFCYYNEGFFRVLTVALLLVIALNTGKGKLI